MELLGLDAAFEPVRTLQCVNIQWNRRYYEAGEFALQLRAADWETAIAYLYAADRPETGMVQKVETEHTVKGDFVNVSGFFLEGMLNWKAVYPRCWGVANVADQCRAMAAPALADTGVTVAAGPALGGNVAFDLLGDQLGDATYALLQLQELSQRIRLQYPDGGLCYEVWQGLDRCQSQSENAYAVFSQGFGTVDALTLTRDTSDYRNVAIAVFDGGAITVDIRASAAEVRRELVVETGLSQEDAQSAADFYAAVDTAARAELAKHPQLVNLDATVLQQNALYRREYDLGDKCDVRDDRLQLAYEARIIEVNEVWKNNTHQVSLQFGEKLPVAYRRIG